MNTFVLFAVCLLLVCVLVVLHRWQRRIEETVRLKAAEELEEALERGSAKPLAQHPHIAEHACIGCGACIAACPEDGVLGLVGGIAKVIHGARCIGHGLCATACPVNAITIGLGELATAPDMPILDERLETSVPGMHIAGELGGMALIRVAVEQGVRAIDVIAREVAEERRRKGRVSRVAKNGMTIADVLIVGAGPAGFAASLRALELGLYAVTIDQDDIGGTVRKYPRRKLTLTGRLSLPLYGPLPKTEFLKEELIELWEEIVERFGLEIHSGVKFLRAHRSDEGFLAETSAGGLVARKILLALGRRGTPRRLGVPGEEQEKVLYQLIDAASYRGQRILIAGGGDSAAEAALGLAAQPGNDVTISYRRNSFFRLKRRNEVELERAIAAGKIRVFFQSEVTRIDATEVMLTKKEDGAETPSKRIRLPNDFVFIFAGGEPPYPLLRELGVRLHGDVERGIVEEIVGEGENDDELEPSLARADETDAVTSKSRGSESS